MGFCPVARFVRRLWIWAKIRGCSDGACKFTIFIGKFVTAPTVLCRACADADGYTSLARLYRAQHGIGDAHRRFDTQERRKTLPLPYTGGIRS